MDWIGWIAIAAGLIPLNFAWRANRTTTLRMAIAWTAAAWLSWGFALADPVSEERGYVALCLTGCAGVAVLGARRPHVFAWNFVVLGLLGVMTLPLLEALVIRAHSFNIERKIFLGAILLVTTANYLPTRFWLAASIATVGCGAAYLKLVQPSLAGDFPLDIDWIERIAIFLVPWAGWLARPTMAGDPLDRAWFEFRDRFGFVWAARVKEQFAAAARSAGLPLRLEWSGAQWDEPTESASRDIAIELFAATTKRFVEQASSLP